MFSLKCACCTLRSKFRSNSREPVWPSGKAGKQKDLGSNPLRLSFLFKSNGLWTQSCDFVPHNYETLTWLSSLPILMQKSFRWWRCSDRYMVFLSSHLRTPSPPFTPLPPSLISLMVSVDVKHHVYLLIQQLLFSRDFCVRWKMIVFFFVFFNNLSLCFNTPRWFQFDFRWNLTFVSDV